MVSEAQLYAARRLTGGLLAIALLLGAIYALAVVNLALLPSLVGTGPRNAVPFRTITSYLTDAELPAQVRMRNLAGNLVMLLPLGILAAAVTRLRVSRALLALVAASAGVELWQLLVATGRSVDVDDVILNSIGAIAGYGLGLAALRAATPSTITEPGLEHRLEI